MPKLRSPAGPRCCPAQPEVAARDRDSGVHGRDRRNRPRSPVTDPTSMLTASNRIATALAAPVRHDRPRAGRLLGGRCRDSSIAAPRVRGRGARHRRRNRARRPRRLRGRDHRRDHQLLHQRLPRHPPHPAPGRHLRLPEEPGHVDHGACTRARAVGLRGAHPAQPGPLAQEPRLRARREGDRRVDLADRLRRADAEHDQPHRSGVRPRLLHLAPHRCRPRVPGARRQQRRELGLQHVLGPGRLVRPTGRVVGVRVPRCRTRADRPRPGAAARRNRRGQQPAAAHREDPKRLRRRLVAAFTGGRALAEGKA